MTTDVYESDGRLRKVLRTGVRFEVEGIGGRYWAPVLANRVGCYVMVRFLPVDDVEADLIESILIFCGGTGEFLCEAWLLGEAGSRYGISDMRREFRNQLRHGNLRRRGSSSSL